MDNNNYNSYNSYDNASGQQANNYQQPPYGQPYNTAPQYQQPYGYYQQPAIHPGRSYAIAGMILGIVSFFIMTLVTGVLAIVFGCIARSKGFKTPMANSGIILGSISIGIGLLVIFFVAVLASASHFYF